MKKIILVDMDGVTCDINKANCDSVSKLNYKQAAYGFFANMLPIDGAIEAVKLLDSDPRYSVHIATAPSIYNPLCYTEKRVWVENYLGMGMVAKLNIVPDKSLMIGDYLIDDNLSGRGQDRFKGKLIHFGGKDFPDWEAVLRYFK